MSKLEEQGAEVDPERRDDCTEKNAEPDVQAVHRIGFHHLLFSCEHQKIVGRRCLAREAYADQDEAGNDEKKNGEAPDQPQPLKYKIQVFEEPWGLAIRAKGRC